MTNNLCFPYSWSPECAPEQGGVAHLGGAGDAAELLHLGLLATRHHHLVERGQAARPHRPAGEAVFTRPSIVRSSRLTEVCPDDA